MGLETEIIGPEEIRKLAPITNVEGVLGGLYDPLDGHLDPSGTTHAYCAGRQDGRGRDRAAHAGDRDQPPPGRDMGRW